MIRKLFKKSTYRTIKTKLFPYKKIDDEFYKILYLTANGSTLFIPENLYCIDYAIRNLPTDDPVIEIGSFTGMSTNMLLSYLEKHARKNILFNCDRWEFEEKDRNFFSHPLKKTPDEIQHYIKDAFVRNLSFFSAHHLPYTIESFSDEFFDKWSQQYPATDIFGRAVKLGGAISFAFIDGNHNYEFVKRDFEHVNKFLVKNGFIFFDDSAAHIETGVRDIVKEVKKRNDYELVVRNPNYLFKKIK